MDIKICPKCRKIIVLPCSHDICVCAESKPSWTDVKWYKQLDGSYHHSGDHMDSGWVIRRDCRWSKPWVLFVYSTGRIEKCYRLLQSAKQAAWLIQKG